MPPSPDHSANHEPGQRPSDSQAPPLAASLARGAASTNAPIQQLAAARLDADHAPDGIPTLRARGRRVAVSPGARPAALTPVQRQERRARYVAIAIAVPVILLLVWLSIETFAPPLQRPAQGNAPQQAYATTTATTVSLVHGGAGNNDTPTPTTQPSPQPGTVPTAIPSTDTPVPPTATPLPPTPTLNPQGTDATVTFNRVHTDITLSPTTVTACDSCGFNPGNATINAPYATVSLQDIYGQNWNTQYQAGSPASAAQVVLTIQCGSSQSPSFYDCNMSVDSDTHVSQPGGGPDCTLNSSPHLGNYGDQTNVGCTLVQAGRLTFNFGGARVPAIQGGFLTGITIVVVGENTYFGGSNGSNGKYLMPYNCYVYGNSFTDARNDAINKANSNLAGQDQGYPDVLAGPSVSVTSGPYCSDSRGIPVARGSQMPSYSPLYFYHTSDVNGYKFVYKKTDVPALQQARLQAAAPANYIYDPTHSSVCLASSVTPASVDVGSKRATFNCAYTGQAMWPWTSAEQDALRAIIAGQSVASAQGTIAGTQGVAGGVSIKITGCAAGNCTKLPTDPNKIAIVINDP